MGVYVYNSHTIQQVVNLGVKGIHLIYLKRARGHDGFNTDEVISITLLLKRNHASWGGFEYVLVDA